MIISFDSLPTENLEHLKGGQKKLVRQCFSDDKMMIFRGTLEPGASIGLHKHEINSEVIYILEGCGQVLYHNEYLPINEGLCHYCPKGESHSLINNSDKPLVFIGMVPAQ